MEAAMKYLTEPLFLGRTGQSVAILGLSAGLSALLEIELMMKVVFVLLVSVMGFYLRRHPMVFGLSVMLLIKLMMPRESFEMVEPKNDVYPGCEGVGLSDILGLFDNDAEKAEKELFEMGIPKSLKLTEADAPRIATYLINKGMMVSDVCKFPPQLEGADIADKGYVICTSERK